MEWSGCGGWISLVVLHRQGGRFGGLGEETGGTNFEVVAAMVDMKREQR